MDKLITSIAESLKNDQITNNIKEEFQEFISDYDKWKDFTSISTIIARILSDSFFSRGYKDVYPYAVMFTNFKNELLNIDERAILIGIKGQSLEFSNIDVVDCLEFTDHINEIEHELYDIYPPTLDNVFLPSIFEYKRCGMKRVEGFEKEFGRNLDSAFILRIPIHDE